LYRWLFYSDGGNYLWSTGETTATLEVIRSGKYWVDIMNGSCTATDTVNIIFYPEVDLGEDTNLCDGNQLVLDVTNPNGIYEWYNGHLGPVLTVDTAGVYWVKVVVGECDRTDTIMVNIVDYPDLFIGNDSTFCNGSVKLGPPVDHPVLNALGIKYQWSTGDTTAFIIVNEPGAYSVQANTYCGAFHASISLNCDPSIFIPNIFSPNNDQKNQVFFTYGENIEKFEMYIYDRWGTMVFQSEDMNIGWNGKMNANSIEAPEGTYIYVVNATDINGKKHRYIGHVSLLR